MPESKSAEHELKCMEIWGGHGAAERKAVSSGLEAWISSTPYRGEAAGGDVHYLSLCVGGIVTRVVLADVSGHGDMASASSATLKSLLRRFMNTKRQDRLVDELNRAFTKIETEGRFATAIVTTYLSHKQRLLLTNAGHPRPLFYSQRTQEWSILQSGKDARPIESTDSTNLPFGIRDSVAYSNHSLPIVHGDMLLLYTDAFTEAADPQGKLLGEAALLELVRSMDAHLPVDEFGPQLLAAVRNYTSGESSDDETLIVMRFGKGRNTPGVLERLKGYAAVLTAQ